MLAALWALGTAFAADPAPAYLPSAKDFMDDLVVSSARTHDVSMVMWLPTEFWSVVAREQGQEGTPQMDELARVFDKYVLVAVVDGEMSALGAATFHTEEEVRRSLKMIDATGRQWDPLPPEKLDPSVAMFSMIIGPMFSQMMGQLGEHLVLYYFPARDESGAELADPRTDSVITFRVREQDYVFHLPLESLFEPRACPKCARQLSGAYNFCPFDGAQIGAPPAPPPVPSKKKK